MDFNVNLLINNKCIDITYFMLIFNKYKNIKIYLVYCEQHTNNI